MMATDSHIHRNMSFEVFHAAGTLSKANSIDNFCNNFGQNDSVANLLARLERITSTSSISSIMVMKDSPTFRKEVECEVSSNPWDICFKNVEDSLMPLGKIIAASPPSRPEKTILESSSSSSSSPRKRLRPLHEDGEEDSYTTDDVFAPLPLSNKSEEALVSADEHEAFRQAIATLAFDFSATCDSPSSKKKRIRTSTSSSRGIDNSDDMDLSVSSEDSETTTSSRKRRRTTCRSDLEKSMTLMGPNLELALRYQALLKKSTESQKALEEWDRKNGLPRSHCQTMVNSSRSRKQLQSGLILPKWNGKPLLDIPGAKVVGLHTSRRLLNDDESE